MLSLKIGIFYCDAAMPTVLARRTMEESRSTALKVSDFETQEIGFPDKIRNMIRNVFFLEKHQRNRIFNPETQNWGNINKSFLNNSPCSFRTRVPLQKNESSQVRFHQKWPGNTNTQGTLPPSRFTIPLAPKPAKNLRLYGESYSWNSNSCLWIYVLLYLGCLCAGSMVRLRYLGTNGKGSRTSSKCCGWEQLGTSATRFVRLFSFVKLA